MAGLSWRFNGAKLQGALQALLGEEPGLCSSGKAMHLPMATPIAYLHVQGHQNHEEGVLDTYLFSVD